MSRSGDQNKEIKDLKVEVNRLTKVEKELLESAKEKSFYQLVCDDLNQKKEIKDLKSEVNRLTEVERGLLKTSNDREKEILDLKLKDAELFCNDLEQETKLTDLKSELSDSALRIRELEIEITRKDELLVKANDQEQVMHEFIDKQYRQYLEKIDEVEKLYDKLLIEAKSNSEKEIHDASSNKESAEFDQENLEKKTKLTDLKSELSDSALRIRELEIEITRKDELLEKANNQEQETNEFFDKQQERIQELERKLARLVEVEKQYDKLLIEAKNNREKEIIIHDASSNIIESSSADFDHENRVESDKNIQVYENNRQIAENNDQENDNESRELPIFHETIVNVNLNISESRSVSPEIPKLEEPVEYVLKSDDEGENITTGWAKSQVPFFSHKKVAHVLSIFLF